MIQNARLFADGAHCAAIQLALNVLSANIETLRVCEENGFACLNRGPLAMGLLTGKFNSDSSFPANDVRHSWEMKSGVQAERLRNLDAIQDILTSAGRSLAQGAICWLWAVSARTIPIPGFKNSAQIEDNLGALAFDPLTSDQVRRIDQLLNRE